jgi:hypothetical protein
LRHKQLIPKGDKTCATSDEVEEAEKEIKPVS